MCWIRNHSAGVAGIAVLVVGLLIRSLTSVDSFVEGEYDQAEMDAAIAEARASVDEFLDVMKQGDGENFSVKVAIPDGDQTEVFWLDDISYHEDQFSGLISNEPRVVTNVHYGQPWTVPREEAIDWLYFRHGKMHGNFTMRPLLKGMSPKQRRQAEEMMADR